MKLFSPISLIILCLIYPITPQTPSLVIELFRSGARSPLRSTYDIAQNWLYYNELTPVGMRQQYILGAAIKLNYEPDVGLLAYNPATLYVRSAE
jgi:hypothetical protein